MESRSTVARSIPSRSAVVSISFINITSAIAAFLQLPSPPERERGGEIERVSWCAARKVGTVE